MTNNRTPWRAWVAALAFFGIAGSILYSGVFKEDRVYGIDEPGSSSTAFPFGDELDLAAVGKRQTRSFITNPRVQPSQEVGVDLSSLFRSVPQGAALQGNQPFAR